MLQNQSLRTGVLSCILIVLTFCISGCWDRKEIENRGFVMGLAIDHVITPEPKGQYDTPHVTQEAGERKYRLTFELPKLSKGKEGEKGKDAGKHTIFVGEGESLFAISRAMNARNNSTLFFEDMQLLVFSESVAREGIGDLLDFFVRNSAMRRRVKLVVTPGRAEDILKSKMQVGEINSLYVTKITKNIHSVERFSSKTDLVDIFEAIRSKRSFFMPVLVMEKGDVKLTKAALFNKDAKLIGELDEWEIIGAKILRTVLKGGVYTVPNPADPEKLATFEMAETMIEINSHVKDDKLWFTLDAKFIGNLGENMESQQQALDPVFLAAVQQELVAQFTRQVEAAYYKQQELKTELCDLRSIVHRQHPQYWKKVKDRWDDEVFPTVPLEVNIKVVVQRTGMIK